MSETKKFLVYSSQDADKHKDEDVYEALRNDAAKYSPNVMDVGKILREFYRLNSNWDVVKEYLEEYVCLNRYRCGSGWGKFRS